MKAPRKAVILAAGLGTRMRPLTHALPKAMLPLWNKPLIDRTLGMLADWGVREVLINLHHAPDPLVAHVTRRLYPRPADAPRTPHAAPGSPPIRVCFSFEPEIVGTGGALARADWFLDEPWFWMINADVAADVDPAPFLRVRDRLRPIAALWLTDSAGPRTVEMEQGLVTNFRSDRAGCDGTYTFCGLQLLSNRILRHVPLQGFSTIVAAYEDARRNGLKVAGVCQPRSFWADVGTPDDYLRAHAETLARQRGRMPGGRLCSPDRPRPAALCRAGARVRGWVSASGNVTAGRAALVQDSILGDGVRIEPRADVRDVIAACGAHLRGRVRGVCFPVASGGDPLLLKAVRMLGWPADRSTAILMPARGSARAFTRVQASRASAIVIRYTLDRPENALYVQNVRLLKRLGIRVPAVLLDLPEDRLTAIEDLGDSALLDRVRGQARSATLRLYRRVLDEVWTLHRHGAATLRMHRAQLCPPFSDEVYGYEHDLFRNHFLRGLRLPPARVRRIMAELKWVAQRLKQEPLRLVHRDLQSTNILWRRGRPAFIDLQGMRLGPAVYDLASLLCDPYVCLAADVQEALLVYYSELSRRPIPELRAAFWLAAVERLAQALGAFGRLGANPDTRDFARHTKPAIGMLARALEHVDNLPALRHTVLSVERTMEK